MINFRERETSREWYPNPFSLNLTVCVFDYFYEYIRILYKIDENVTDSIEYFNTLRKNNNLCYI